MFEWKILFVREKPSIIHKMDSPNEGEQQQHEQNDGGHNSSNSSDSSNNDTNANMPIRKVYAAPMKPQVRFDFVLCLAADNSVCRLNTDEFFFKYFPDKR